MESYFLTFILGIVQAVTEFLPVSSSGHLLLFRFFTGFSVPESLAFDVSLHVGSALALIVYFRTQLWSLIQKYRSQETRLLVSAVAMTALIGYFVEPFLSDVRQPLVIAFMLILGGLLFFWVEKKGTQVKKMGDMTLKQALGIGLVQSLAFIPGVSRSGITIIAGMWGGLKREEAAVFSFLMGAPLLMLAGAKKGLDLMILDAQIPWDLFLIGSVTSAVVSFVVIHLFLQLIRRYSLTVFGWYRIILGAFVILWMLL